MCLSQILLFQWRLGFGGWESNREGDGQMDKVLATQTLGPKFQIPVMAECASNPSTEEAEARKC